MVLLSDGSRLTPTVMWDDVTVKTASQYKNCATLLIIRIANGVKFKHLAPEWESLGNKNGGRQELRSTIGRKVATIRK